MKKIISALAAFLIAFAFPAVAYAVEFIPCDVSIPYNNYYLPWKNKELETAVSIGVIIISVLAVLGVVAIIIVKNKKRSVTQCLKLWGKLKLLRLMRGDAAVCFPSENPEQWDGAFFILDLIKEKLFVQLTTYDGHYAGFESVSAAEFHKIAIKYDFRKELQSFKTEEDWERLFDSELRTAVSQTQSEIR